MISHYYVIGTACLLSIMLLVVIAEELRYLRDNPSKKLGLFRIVCLSFALCSGLVCSIYSAYKATKRIEAKYAGQNSSIYSYDDYFYISNLDKFIYWVGFKHKSKPYVLSLFMDPDKILYRISYGEELGFNQYLYAGEIKNQKDAEKLIDIARDMIPSSETYKLVKIDHKIKAMFGYIHSDFFPKEGGKQHVQH